MDQICMERGMGNPPLTRDYAPYSRVPPFLPLHIGHGCLSDSTLIFVILIIFRTIIIFLQIVIVFVITILLHIGVYHLLEKFRIFFQIGVVGIMSYVLS